MEMCEGEKFDAVYIKLEGSGEHFCDTRYLRLTYAHSRLGTATTFVKPPLLSPGASKREHKQSQTFLTLQEPVDRSELRRIRTTDVGWFYNIPFRFEVPLTQREPREWQNRWGDSVRQPQLELPPSYDKNSVPSTAPNIAKIEYCITAKLLRHDTVNVSEGASHVTRVIEETSRVIRIVPVVNEQPPLQHCSTPGKESVAVATTYLEGKTWTRSQGRFETEVAQPKSFCVPISTGYDTCPKQAVETSAVMNLRFEPKEVDGIPPRLTRISAKLRAATRVSSIPMSDRPYQIGSRKDGTEDGLSVETIPLVGGTVQEVKWHRDLTKLKNNAVSLDKDGGRTPFTTVLPLRLVLPPKKQYLPTFHFSLISHFYVIILVLNFQLHGEGISSKKGSICLEVPIQLSSEIFVNRDSHFSDDSDG